MSIKQFDIAIIGGGHAGCEAAWIASQFNLSVVLISMPGVPLGSMPCNPSIGGVGKGQLVRELAVLGGLMPEIADRAAIQCRTLNESKGSAVQSTRFQADVELYPKLILEALNKCKNLQIINIKVASLDKTEIGWKVSSVDSSEIFARSLVLTTGTFLNGLLHTGNDKTFGGRKDMDSSPGFAELFPRMNIGTYRFKTGTPARLRKSTIDFSKLTEQPSDVETPNYSFLHHYNQRFVPQLSCFVAHTNERTMQIIRDSKDQSPLFNGQISGVGPRYCPSIEDKAFRYPDRNVHHVFLEPESHYNDRVYPNGLSTSLPKEVQLKFLRSIEGLENVEVDSWGYAVEYDVIDSSLLSKTLEHKDVATLYFAGQVNGTSGYEEAAAQGFVAGANAALKLIGSKELVFSRFDSYIGVLVDDITLTRPDEPYRLFTARAENRLYCREDNVLTRLYPYRALLGLHHSFDFVMKKYAESEDSLRSFLKSEETNEIRKLVRDIKDPTLNPVTVLKDFFQSMELSVDLRTTISLAFELKYDGYVKRAAEQFDRIHTIGNKALNLEILLADKNISFECKQRIQRFRPSTFSDLMRIEGIRKATLVWIASTLS